jgi:heme/copper-type cytochrome/quinol oxidase subunit 3
MGRGRYRPEAIVPDGIAAMLIFVATEIMFFAGLISAFVIVKAGSLAWPPPGQPRLPVEATAFNSLVLLASGVVLFLTNRRFDEPGATHRTRKLLDITMGMGAFFVVVQGYEWAQLLGFGLTMTSSTYGAFFYLIVGAHALHAVAALIALGYSNLQFTRGELTRAAFLTTQIFWYFVVGLWPFLYVLVYLM